MCQLLSLKSFCGVFGSVTWLEFKSEHWKSDHCQTEYSSFVGITYMIETHFLMHG